MKATSLIFSVLLFPVVLYGQTGTVSVDARSNLYLAGGNGVGGSYLLDGIFPAFVHLAQGKDRIATFRSAGSWSCGAAPHPVSGPEVGSCAFHSTDINSLNSIAGIRGPN